MRRALTTCACVVLLAACGPKDPPGGDQQPAQPEPTPAAATEASPPGTTEDAGAAARQPVQHTLTGIDLAAESVFEAQVELTVSVGTTGRTEARPASGVLAMHRIVQSCPLGRCQDVGSDGDVVVPAGSVFSAPCDGDCEGLTRFVTATAFTIPRSGEVQPCPEGPTLVPMPGGELRCVIGPEVAVTALEDGPATLGGRHTRPRWEDGGEDDVGGRFVQDTYVEGSSGHVVTEEDVTAAQAALEAAALEQLRADPGAGQRPGATLERGYLWGPVQLSGRVGDDAVTLVASYAGRASIFAIAEEVVVAQLLDRLGSVAFRGQVPGTDGRYEVDPGSLTWQVHSPVGSGDLVFDATATFVPVGG